MSAFLAALRKDLRRRIRSPLAAVVLLLFPVVFSLLIGATFGSGGETLAPIKLALVDEDGGLLSRFVQTAFTQNESQGPARFDVAVVSYGEAIDLVESDKVSAVLRIPAAFTDSLLAECPVALELIKNPAQGIYPEIAQQVVEVLAQLAGAAVRVLGEPVREIRAATSADRAPSDELVTRISLAANRRMRGVGRYALPPAIRLEAAGADSAEGESASPLRVAVYVLPGMAVYALLMLALVSAQDFQRERVRGTMARQFVSPAPFAAIVLGKLAAIGLVSLVSVAILAVVAVLWARVAVSLAGFVVLSVAFAVAATGFAALIHSLTRSERSGALIGSILVMLMSMAGGSFVPFEMLPPFVRAIAPFTMTYWASAGYKELLFSSAGVEDLLPHVGILAAIGVAFTAFATERFAARYRTGG